MCSWRCAMNTFVVQKGQRDRICIALIVYWRGNCRVCVAILVLGSPKYKFYFVLSVWNRSSSKHFPSLSFQISRAQDYPFEGKGRFRSRFPSLAVSKFRDNIGLHWNLAKSICCKIFGPLFWNVLKENHLIPDSVLDVSSAKVRVFVQFCFENFHESVNVRLFLNSLLSMPSLMTFLVGWAFFTINISKGFLYSVSFRRNSFTVVFCYLVEACKLNPGV